MMMAVTELLRLGNETFVFHGPILVATGKRGWNSSYFTRGRKETSMFEVLEFCLYTGLATLFFLRWQGFI